MEYLDLNLSLYGCLIFLAIIVEAVVQGLRKGKITRVIFGLIPPIYLSVILSLLVTIPFRLQFFNIMFAIIYAQIPWWLDSFCLAMVISRGSSWIHEKANQMGINRDEYGMRIQYPAS
jgi:uncharacterized membrane protein